MALVEAMALGKSVVGSEAARDEAAKGAVDVIESNMACG